MRAPSRPSALRAAFLAAFFFLGFLGGCASLSPRELLNPRDLAVTYQPAPGSAEFQRLGLEKTPSVVVLKVDGDDVQSNIRTISQALLRKGYSVRDYGVALEELAKSGLLHRKPLDPETIQRASRVFTEAAAVAGTVEVLQMEPLNAQLSLAWIDLRTGKILWTAKAAYS
ncbi:MAG: hypothetical protein AABZ64_14775, partial [Nitrospinota bacterium]